MRGAPFDLKREEIFPVEAEAGRTCHSMRPDLRNCSSLFLPSERHHTAPKQISLSSVFDVFSSYLGSHNSGTDCAFFWFINHKNITISCMELSDIVQIAVRQVHDSISDAFLSGHLLLVSNKIHGEALKYCSTYPLLHTSSVGSK